MARSYVAEARRRGLGRRRERIGPIVERLAVEHSDATIALRFRSDVELLISVMLSAQTTDVNVNRVTERLFTKYRRPEDYLAANLLASGGESVVEEGAIVEGTLDRCVVWSDARVHRNEALSRCIRARDRITVMVR